ncbi:MAG TPA: hypothetical protein VK457_10925 [Chloroflexota bacterium]|nr:hypothetical protein [Chloroflexota bacterium]
MSVLERVVEVDMLLAGAPRPMACSMPRRRLRDVLAETNLLDVQLQIIQQAAGPHRLKGVAQRIAALHRRLDALERRLRLRTRHLGFDNNLHMSVLRKQLTQVELGDRFRDPERRTPLFAGRED